MPYSPLQYPEDTVTIVGNTLTVDEALNNPTTITRDIADLSTQRLGMMARIFQPSGGIEGGNILFERPNPLATDLYSTRDVKEVMPGTEFPELTFDRGVPMIARPRKIGGKWKVTKESRKRNRTSLLARYIRQTANTITRRIELLGMAELAAVVTAEARFRTGTSWSAYAAQAPQVRTGTTGPVADILATTLAIDLEERGNVLTGIVLHPNQAVSIQQAFPNTPIGTVLGSAGITQYFVTPRQTAGVATMYAPGVGQWRNEFPLAEEVDEETVAEGGRQQTWYQWSISPAFFIEDQFELMEIRGIA